MRRRRVKYCPLCRSELAPRNVDGRPRLCCSSAECRFVHWDNPIPVVASLVRLADSYVLARNVRWPARVFSFLTGFIENGEAPESAAARETQEELGVRAQSALLIGHFPLARLHQLVIAYEIRAAGELTLGDEIAEVKLVSAPELAAYDFGPLALTSEIVSFWLQSERRAKA
jgi:NADH pyrophosphatase NudC (nudix superfamily)